MNTLFCDTSIKSFQEKGKLCFVSLKKTAVLSENLLKRPSLASPTSEKKQKLLAREARPKNRRRLF